MLAHVDPGVGPHVVLHYPTLQMSCSSSTTVRVTRLNETGRCVDLELTRELLAHRRIGFGASTATPPQFNPRDLRSFGRYKEAPSLPAHSYFDQNSSGGNSANCGNLSVISYHDALEAVWM